MAIIITSVHPFRQTLAQEGDIMKTKFGLSMLTAICLFLFSVAFLAVSGAATPGKADKESILEAYGELPLYFIENKGQLDSKVRFYVKTSGQTLYFTDEGIVFDLLRREEEAGKGTEGAEKGRQTTGVKRERLVFNLRFENAQKGVLIEGLDRQDAGINYFVGNDRSKWKRGIPTYKGVIYQGVYKGIDLKVFGNGKDIEYEFIVNPGGTPDDILLTYNGIEGLATNGEGELLIATAFGELKETRPYIYQEIEGKRAVDGSFEIRSPADQSQARKFSYGFQVASYNPSYPLIIDPTLSYSTYLGGSEGDFGHGIAVDGSGNAYVTGSTYADFPTQNPYQGTKPGNYDAFITKLSSSGGALTYSTYLGGSRYDYGKGIAVDGSGNAYVTGETNSTNFPTQNPYQGTNAGERDAFITKLSSSGSALSYSTYLGGVNVDNGWGIAVDGSGNAYVTGYTQSTNFPTQNPYQRFYATRGDAFITKLSSSGSALTYSTYLGGSYVDRGYGIAVDGSGNAYVTGETSSGDFPTHTQYQKTYAGYYDAFITKLSSSGNTLSYSSYLGGDGYDCGDGIAVDGSGNAYVTGDTESIDFPTQNPYQGTNAGYYDAFVAKLSTTSPTVPTATTQAVTGIGTTTATGNGNITILGDPNPTQHGVCWDTNGTPTIVDSKTEEGPATATGAFTSNMTGLSPNTTYYVRAYATNSAGTGYGNDISFKTSYASTLYVSSNGCGDKTPCYDSIQNAINDAATGSAILIAGGTYDGNFTVDGKSLTLQGGWDTSFENQNGTTTLQGAPKAPLGSLTLQELKIQPE